MHRVSDIAIIGGAMMGSSVAWWLRHLGYEGKVTVIEADPTYGLAATSATNSCVRHQFDSAINIKISQFCGEFCENFNDYMGEDAPKIPIQNFGYLYLVNNDEGARHLRDKVERQRANGAHTRLYTPRELADLYPFYRLDDIVLASHNTHHEGYFDGGTIFDHFRNGARRAGVTYLADRVTGLTTQGGRITALRLASGDSLPCGAVVNATGTRANEIMAMVGLSLPIEARKRLTYILKAAEPLPCDLPLTIDPSGVHIRSEGDYYMAGCAPDEDYAVAVDDFSMDHHLWETKAWPAIATRIPAFERVKLQQEWVGHYDYNTFDQNAILGLHPETENLYMVNGFSGHGLQQAPAVGRGIAELLIHGSYQTLDLSPLEYARIQCERPNIEANVI